VSATLVDVLGLLERDVAERVEAGKCGCGCDADLPVDRKAGTMFISKAHHQRVYRRRMEAACKAVGQPCRVNLQLVLASNGSQTVHRGRKTGPAVPHKPSGMQVAYYKAVDLLIKELGDYVAKGAGVDHAEASRIIRDAVTKALPERQRKRLQDAAELREAA